MPDPHPNARLESTEDKLCLVVDDLRWRVHDCDFRNFKAIRQPLGAPDAQSRYFVSEADVRRIYQRKKQDDHDLELATLIKQLSSAGWAARDRLNAADVKPT